MIAFEFEGKNFTATVQLPDGDVDRLAEAEIIWDGNGDQRFTTSLLPENNGYLLVLGAREGVPTAETMQFNNLNASATVTQKLTGPEDENSDQPIITLSGTSPTEEEDSFR